MHAFSLSREFSELTHDQVDKMKYLNVFLSPFMPWFTLHLSNLTRWTLPLSVMFLSRCLVYQLPTLIRLIVRFMPKHYHGFRYWADQIVTIFLFNFLSLLISFAQDFHQSISELVASLKQYPRWSWQNLKTRDCWSQLSSANGSFDGNWLLGQSIISTDYPWPYSFNVMISTACV